MIHHYTCQAFMILLLFTVPYYHFLFLRYLVLAEHRFSSDILVPFPDLSNLYSSVRWHIYFPISQQLISVKNKLLRCFMQTSQFIFQFTSCVIRLWLLRTLFLGKTGLGVRWQVRKWPFFPFLTQLGPIFLSFSYTKKLFFVLRIYLFFFQNHWCNAAVLAVTNTKFFFRTTGFQQKLLLLIKSPNIFCWKST